LIDDDSHAPIEALVTLTFLTTTFTQVAVLDTLEVAALAVLAVVTIGRTPANASTPTRSLRPI
jgi:hypothetical protein